MTLSPYCRPRTLAIATLAAAVVLAGCAGSPSRPSRQPAATPSVRGAASSPVPTPFVLDGGGLVVVPARSERAGWGSPAEALAQARGSLQVFTAQTSARILAPPVVELARVTVAPGLPHGGVGINGAFDSGRASPEPTYRNRLAWVVRVRISPGTASCPTMIPASPVPVEPGHRGYVVVVRDATRGGDAIAYTERGPKLCGQGATGPSVEIPRGLVAVPWQVVERRPHDVTLRYDAPACAEFDEAGDMGRGNAEGFAVVVAEPLGPRCTGSRQATITLQDVGLHDRPYPPGPLGTGP